MLQDKKCDISGGFLYISWGCHYWYFKDVGFKFEPQVCNKCHDVLITVYELKNIAILDAKGVDFRCILWGICRDEAVNRLNNSVLENKGLL